MGYVMVAGPCLICKRIFSYNPHHVPSLRRSPEQPREPVCSSCMTYANEIRGKRGLPPLTIDPEAYHPLAEEEL